MSPFELSSDAAETATADLIVVGEFATEQQAAEHGLVILAAGAAYWLQPSNVGWSVLVETARADHVRSQLAAYARESTRWPPPPFVDPWTPRPADLLTPLLWVAAALAAFHAFPPGSAAAELGRLDAHAVIANGEVWRLFTALFLHADVGHLAANLCSGALIFTAIVHTFGTRRGWFLLAAGGILGNALVALVAASPGHFSVGASTAIFAGVGLLTGRAARLRWRSPHPHRWRGFFSAAATGLIVLGLYGAGGQRVDVGAHLAGFLAGAVLGAAASHQRRSRMSRSAARV